MPDATGALCLRSSILAGETFALDCAGDDGDVAACSINACALAKDTNDAKQMSQKMLVLSLVFMMPHASELERGARKDEGMFIQAAQFLFHASSFRLHPDCSPACSSRDAH